MTTYSILVSTEPYKYEVTDDLINLCEAILEKGNQIKGIFFYESGVYNIKKNIPIDYLEMVDILDTTPKIISWM